MNRTSFRTRRQFLGTASAWAGAALLPWSRAAAWAAAGPASPLRITFFTDVHARLEWDTPEAMGRCADRIKEQAADLVICGGDLITDGFTSTSAQVAPRWARVRETLLDRCGAPVHAALGNHDLVGVVPDDGHPAEPEPRRDFLRATGLERTYRSMDAGGCHIVFLDPIEPTGDALRYRGVIGPGQLQWLRDDLAGVEARTPVIVMTHMPLLTGFFQATQGATTPAPVNRVVVNSRDVLELFRAHNLVAVLQGHLHVNELLRWRNTTFITGGAVCGQWWRGPWQGTPEGFGVITLRDDRVEWAYQEYGWQARRPRGA